MNIKYRVCLAGVLLPAALAASGQPAFLDIHVNPSGQIDEIHLQGNASMQWVTDPAGLSPPANGVGETYPHVALLATTPGQNVTFTVSTVAPEAYPFHVIYHSCGALNPETAVLWAGAESNGQSFTYLAPYVTSAACDMQSGIPGVLSIYPLSFVTPYAPGDYVLNFNN